tara:strand:+ start:6601 stop:6714 length:114 start_codon:yes stop_codon:yes gene_type:complete
MQLSQLAGVLFVMGKWILEFALICCFAVVLSRFAGED